MFGGKLGDLDAYVPLGTQSAGIGGVGGGESALVWMKNQYREALDRARREGKLVLRQLHRLRLHQLPLDEGQHVHPAGNRRRPEELRPGGTLHRRHRRGVRGQSETAARQIQHRRRSLLRHPRSRREGDRHLPRPHQAMPRSTWHSCKKPAPPRRRTRSTPPPRRRIGLPAVTEAGWRHRRHRRALRQSRGGQLLGHLVRPLHSGDPQLQQAAQGFRRAGRRRTRHLDG